MSIDGIFVEVKFTPILGRRSVPLVPVFGALVAAVEDDWLAKGQVFGHGLGQLGRLPRVTPLVETAACTGCAHSDRIRDEHAAGVERPTCTSVRFSILGRVVGSF